MREKNLKKELVKNLAIVILFTLIPFQLLMWMNEKIGHPTFMSIVYMISIVFVFLTVKQVGKPRALGYQLSNMKMIFSHGWYILIVSVALGVLNFFSISFNHSPSVSQIVLFILETALGVVFEELLFRGVIQNKLIEYYEFRGKSVWGALVISSLIFGLTHILNLIGQPYFVIGTLTQVIYTFSLGILIGCVYWRSGNIWIAFLLHFIFNILGSYGVLFADQIGSHGDISLKDAGIQILFMFPCVVLAYIICKKDQSCKVNGMCM